MGVSTNVIGGMALIVGCLKLWAAYDAHKNGRGTLWGHFGPFLSTQKEGDPVGFKTVVWGNLAVGFVGISIAFWFFLLADA